MREVLAPTFIPRPRYRISLSGCTSRAESDERITRKINVPFRLNPAGIRSTAAEHEGANMSRVTFSRAPNLENRISSIVFLLFRRVIKKWNGVLKKYHYNNNNNEIKKHVHRQIGSSFNSNGPPRSHPIESLECGADRMKNEKGPKENR